VKRREEGGEEKEEGGEEREEGGEEREKRNMNIKMDLISEDKVNSMGSMEKIRFVLDGVKSGNIVVLEGGLTSEEQMKLIELAMLEVDEDFTGIEMSGYPSKKGFFNLRKKTRLTVVGPAKTMHTIKKGKDWISAVISEI